MKELEEAQLKLQAYVGSGRKEDGLADEEKGHDQPPSPKRAAPAEPDLDQAKEEFRVALDRYTGSYNELNKWLVNR